MTEGVDERVGWRPPESEPLQARSRDPVAYSKSSPTLEENQRIVHTDDVVQH
jgi:hypothetical protein